MKINKTSVVVSGLGLLLATGLQVGTAAAAEWRCRAEHRSNPERSRISVDGKDLGRTGSYTATVSSNGTATSDPKSPNRRGEIEFDFDSNPKDIAAGATKIAPNFVRGTTTFKVSKDGNDVPLPNNDCAVVSR